MKTNTASPAMQPLLQRIDAFIRKYYLNQMIRGCILAAAALLFAFLFVTISEYFFYLPSIVRSFIFWGFIALAVSSLSYWVVIPLIKYFKLGPVISSKDAAIIIGKHFHEIEDRLLSVLELKEMDQTQNIALIEAGILQKTILLQPISFTNAINLKLNNTYIFRYLAPVVLLFLIIYITNSHIIKDSTRRIVQYQTDFEKEFPFNIQFLSGKLEVIQNNDYTLQLKITGNQIPDELFIVTDRSDVKMSKKGKNIFEYTFAKVQNNKVFRFKTSRFTSTQYELNTLRKPTINSFTVDLQYPPYTQLTNESVKNTGDLSVPEGTVIRWLFNTNNTDELSLLFPSNITRSQQKSNNDFTVSYKALNETPYSIVTRNGKSNIYDSISYSIHVIQDQYPSIDVDEIIDTTANRLHYFSGAVSDDYGLTNLKFKYSIKNEEYPERNIEKTLPVSTIKGKNDLFTYYFNFSSLGLKPGDQISYYFEVWDNDAIHGAKSSKSRIYILDIPSENHLNELIDQHNQQLKKNLEKSISQIQNINKDLQKSQQDLLQKKNMDWEDKKKINDLLNHQKDLYNKLQEMQKDYQNNNNLMNELKQMNPEITEKQKQLNELAQQVLSPEMQELIKKIQDLMEKLNKESTLDQLKSNEKQNEQLEKQLDRLLSLFKQLEFEQKFNDIKDNLKELANKQEELSKETQLGKNKEETSKKQEEINKQFEEIKKDLKDLGDLNNDLENPMNLPDMNEKSDNTTNNLEKSLKEINKGNNSKATDNQKNASKNMKEMAESMENFMENAQKEQMEEDMKSIRQILENIIRISFKQEEIIKKMKKVSTTSTSYVQLIKDQNRVKEDIKMIEDSIQSLAKRQYSIKSYVDEQLDVINTNNEKALSNLVERYSSQAASNQQFIMTSLNNLALMFDESLKQMQQEMNAKMQGNQSCNKPGGKGKPSLANMSQIQKQLNDKLTEMQGQMKQGQKPGQQNGSGMSEQLAKMAAQQSAIRDALRQLNEQYNKDGKSGLGNLNQIQDLMDKTERDLANKVITTETLKRQQEILTKLLDAEKSERERDTDDKRKSETAKDLTPILPPSLQEYIKKRQTETELYRTLPPGLKPFYKSLTEEYFNRIPN